MESKQTKGLRRAVIGKQNEAFSWTHSRGALVICILALGIEAVMLVKEGSVTSWLYPASLLIICLLGASWMIYRNPKFIWSPMPWFLIASAAFFGFGPLLYFFGTKESIAFCDSYYPVSIERIQQVFLLNSVSIGLVLICFEITIRLLKPRVAGQKLTLREPPWVGLFIATFIIGGLARYTMRSWEFGHVPGIIGQLGQLARVSLLPAAYLAVRRGGIWYILVAAASIFEITDNILSLMKGEVLLSLIMLFLGAYLAKPRVKFLVVSGVLMLALYIFVLTPMASIGRQQKENYAYERSIRVLVTEWLNRRDVERIEGGSEIQWWWTRLNYSNAELFAIDQYNEGMPGRSFQLLPYSLIPRLLWANKPTMTAGGDFHSAVTGNAGTSSGPGAFGEAFWNGGWWLLLATCGYIGIYLGFFTKWNLEVLESGRLYLLPSALLAIITGAQPDNFFTSNYVSSLPILIGLGVILWLLFGLPRRTDDLLKHGRVPAGNKRRYRTQRSARRRGDPRVCEKHLRPLPSAAGTPGEGESSFPTR